MSSSKSYSVKSELSDAFMDSVDALCSLPDTSKSSLVLSTSKLIGFLSIKNVFRFVSVGWETLTGQTNESLLSNPWIKFIHSSDKPFTEAAISSLQSGPQGKVIEIINRVYNGSEYVEVTHNIVRCVSGDLFMISHETPEPDPDDDPKDW